jgi:hypothetical protein
MFMVDTEVLSSGSIPPLVFTPSALLDQWTAWKTAVLAAGLHLKLFKNNVIIAPSTALAGLTEAVAPGYAPFAITTLNGPSLDQSGNAYMTSSEAFFVCSGGGSDLCYGAYVVQDTGAAATVTFTLTGGQYTLPVIGSGGAGYLVAPLVTVTGATGSGAILTATITGGVVTAITIVNPGTGYTTATATIAPPNKLVAAANFESPKPLQLSTDSIPVIVEFDNIAA